MSGIERLVDVASTNPVLEKVPEAAPSEPELPERYRGKSPGELAQMHTEAWTTIGRQSNELGELRKRVAELEGAAKAAAEPEADFWEDPETSTRRIVERELEGIKGELQDSRADVVKARLDREHPDWQETVQSDQFAEWVVADSGRLQMFQEANEGLSYQAADSLFRSWAEVNRSEEQIEQARQEAVQEDRNLRASVTEGGSARGTRARSFSRAQLRNLRIQDRAAYEAMLPQIQEAYRTGNVTE